MIVSLGPVIGKCHVPGRGRATVYVIDNKTDFFTVQIDKTGARLIRHRDNIQFRK